MNDNKKMNEKHFFEPVISRAKVRGTGQSIVESSDTVEQKLRASFGQFTEQLLWRRYFVIFIGCRGN